jgi:ribosomal protein S18 acetylase RimI-like enzyme
MKNSHLINLQIGTGPEVEVSQDSILEVEVHGKNFAVEVLSRQADIVEMADLDKRLFGEHKALSTEELRRIQQHGALLAIRDSIGCMIAEAQVITKAIPDAPEPLVQVLPDNYGYFEGFGVAPGHQGTGVGSAAMYAVEAFARQENKTDMWATVRVENMPSVGRLTHGGYRIVAYNPEYYKGEGLAGARLILHKVLDTAEGSVQSISVSTELIKIPVQAGDDVDLRAHKAVQHAFDTGYIGVGASRDMSQSYLLLGKPDPHSLLS